jgi:guanylate kinase
MGKKIILSSLSASGKTTLVDALLKARPNLYRLKTCTSREKRPEETGDEYYFRTKDEMNLMHVCGEFVETSVVYTNIYGLTKTEVDTHSDSDVIVILDVEGMKKFKKEYPDSISVFIDPPPIKELMRRLIERKTSDVDVKNRISMMKKEMKVVKKFDYRIPNGDLDSMVTAFISLIDSIIANK